jgi:hypothetical protein
LSTHVYGAVLRGVSDGAEAEVVELAVLLLSSMGMAVVVGITVDETASVIEAKEAAILEAISSALTDDVGVVDVEVTVVEPEPEEEVSGATT